jgi:NADP-dependent 3-hydroxy acid dehydrogenase YdfG
MTQNIENKVVVITGGSSGLDAEIACHLVKAVDARRLDRLLALAQELGLSGEAIRCHRSFTNAGLGESRH